MMSSFLSPSNLVSFLFAAVALAAAWILFSVQKNKISFFFILFAAFILGTSLHSFHQKNFETNSLRQLELKDYADFYGRLYRSPSRGKDRDYLFLNVYKVRYQNREKKVSGNLRVTVPHSSEFQKKLSLFTNDLIKVSAKLLSDRGYRNFKSSPSAGYLKNQKIHRRAFTKSPLLVEKLNYSNRRSLFRTISLIRQKIQKKIEEYFPSSSSSSISSRGAVLEALLLGERGRMDRSATVSLQKSGLYHLIAISGAHIAIISFLLFSILKLLRFPTRPSYMLLIVLLLFYALLVEGRPSVTRATIMALAFLTAKLLWKDISLLNTISFSAFFLLLFNPFRLFDLGFQLTFAATLSIILFFPRIIKFFPRLPLRISEIMAISISAQLGVLPFVAFSFNRVTFSSLLLNYAALPLVGIIMACGYIFIPLSFVSPFLAKPLVGALNFLITAFLSSGQLTEGLRFLSYRIPGPHPVIIIGYFLFLFSLLLPVKFKKQRLFFLSCFLLFFLTLVTHPFPSYSKNLKITFIDVGRGESILVEFPGRKKMLIDGGSVPGNNFDIGERVVSPFLWSRGIKKIHYLALTHAHPDHINGLKAIVQNFRIGEIWESFSPLENEIYSEFKKSLPPEVLQKRYFRDQTFYEGKIKVEILHPGRQYPFVRSVKNDQSLVLRITYEKTSFLLTGDIGIDAEKEIIEYFQNIKSQVLKSPHHGSRSSSSRDFLKKVSPSIIVISVGNNNSYGLPDRDVIDNYKRTGAEIYRTDIHGAVEISSDGRRLSIRTSEQ